MIRRADQVKSCTPAAAAFLPDAATVQTTVSRVACVRRVAYRPKSISAPM